MCPNGNIDARTLDYAMGAKGKKGNPVEVARREFSKKIREGDTVEMADRSRGQHAVATVRVIREGRVVALIEYRRAGGGWLQDYYEACANFSLPDTSGGVAGLGVVGLVAVAAATAGYLLLWRLLKI